jgi:aminoglycoside phosphotransferase (APT) family kinase protein
MEYEIQRVLFQAGLPVPEPLLLDTSKALLAAPYLVMEMVDGVSVVQKSQVEHAVCTMADFLARLHHLSIDSSKIALLPHREDPVTGALQYVPDVTSWRTLREVISGWQITAEQDTLLHGDFWPGNILWIDDHIAAVIDWEDAAIGTPVSDLAASRGEIMTMYGEQAMETFTRHYLSQASLNLTDLPLWEVYVGFSALATMHSWGLAPQVEAKRRAATTAFVKRAAQTLIAQAG